MIQLTNENVLGAILTAAQLADQACDEPLGIVFNPEITNRIIVEDRAVLCSLAEKMRLELYYRLSEEVG